MTATETLIEQHELDFIKQLKQEFGDALERVDWITHKEKALTGKPMSVLYHPNPPGPRTAVARFFHYVQQHNATDDYDRLTKDEIEFIRNMGSIAEQKKWLNIKQGLISDAMTADMHGQPGSRIRKFAEYVQNKLFAERAAQNEGGFMEEVAEQIMSDPRVDSHRSRHDVDVVKGQPAIANVGHFTVAEMPAFDPLVPVMSQDHYHMGVLIGQDSSNTDHHHRYGDVTVCFSDTAPETGNGLRVGIGERYVIICDQWTGKRLKVVLPVVTQEQEEAVKALKNRE